MATRILLPIPKNIRNAASYVNMCISRHAQTTGSGTTVDQKDVDRHAQQSKEWWSPWGPMAALHTFNVIRVPFIRDGLLDTSAIKNPSPLKGKKILDVGCGGGLLTEPLAALGADVTGIDASNELIECAKNHCLTNIRISTNAPSYICTTIEEHANAFYENYYDGVVASEVLEHVNNKELFIKSCLYTLKPGGRIFFTTPCRTRLSQISVIFLAEYVFKMVPRGTHQIEKFTTPTELTFILERSNCQVEIVHGIFYNFLTNTWHWINNQSFMFALQAKKLGPDPKTSHA